jgi:L-threonylcarbamoyladenylate synthase
VHVSSFKQAESLTLDWPALADFLARVFWPGALTLVLPKATHVNSLITSGLETVAIRYPDHPVAHQLIELVGQPLAAPSANKFGRTSPTTAEHVRSEFAGMGLFVLDGGDCEIGVESTVLAVEENDDGSAVKILRPGGVTEEMLRAALAKWSNPVIISRQLSQASPGSLKHHYQPRIPLVIVSQKEPNGLTAETRMRIQNQIGKPAQKALELVLDEDANLAARELYSEMRTVSESGADCIYVRTRSDRSGVWSAIWDRLTRAASLDLTEA